MNSKKDKVLKEVLNRFSNNSQEVFKEDEEEKKSGFFANMDEIS